MMVGMTGGMAAGMTEEIIAEVCGRLLGNSITAAYLILAVLVIRVLFRKAPAVFRCILWGLVGLRLVLPFDIQIDRGILPTGEEQLRQMAETAGVFDVLWVLSDYEAGINDGTETDDEGGTDEVVGAGDGTGADEWVGAGDGSGIDEWVGAAKGTGTSDWAGAAAAAKSLHDTEVITGEEVLAEAERFARTGIYDEAEVSERAGTYAQAEMRGAEIFFVIWFIGAFGMMGYLAWQYLSLRFRLREAVREEWAVCGEPCEIYLAEGIQTPFLFGVIRPRIYLPYRAKTDYTEYVLRHEQMHRKHFDHVKKTISFILLSIYWFHPLVWLAYFFYGRDMELACDERVIKDYDLEGRKNYSKALLYFAANRRRVQICPLAFGEVGIKERIQKVLDYQKPALWVFVGAAVVVLGACGIFFLNRGAETGSGMDGGAHSVGNGSTGLTEPDLESGVQGVSLAGENQPEGTQASSRIVQEFVDYLDEKGEYVIAVKALSQSYHYDRENKYYYEIMDYVPAMNEAGTAFAWGPYRAVFSEDGRALEVWEKEDKFRADQSQPGFQKARLRLAKDCAYYACYSFSQGAKDEDKRRIDWETCYNLFMENQSYDEVYCSVKYKGGEVTELTLLNVYPTLKTGDDFLGMAVDETDFTEDALASKQQDGLNGSRSDSLYRTKLDGQDYLLELSFYSANGGRAYATYRIYRCEALSRNAFSAVYVDGCHFEIRNAQVSGYPVDYPTKDMEAFYHAILPYVQNADGRWSWGDGTFLDGDYAVYDLSKYWEMNVLTAERAEFLRAQQYTLIQDPRIENPYFSMTVPEEFVGKVGYQVSVDSVAKNFSVTFVLDEAAEKVTRYGMLGEYEQLQDVTDGVLGWVRWQDLKDIVWLGKDVTENRHVIFILTCLDEVDFERAWRVHRLLFGLGGERNAVCYNQDRSGAYCAFVPTDVQYDPENAEEAEQYLAFSALFRELMENGDFETDAFPFIHLTEAEREYLDYIKEHYGQEDPGQLRKSDPNAYRIAKEQGWIQD